MHTPHEDHPSYSHPMPVRTLLTVFFTLIGLTIVTVASAYLPLGSAEIWVSMGIATIKAGLVIFFFMHMLHDRAFNGIVFFFSLAFVALFIGSTLVDAHANRGPGEAEEVPIKAQP